MDRAFGKVHHRCSSPHKQLQTVFNVDLPLSISYYRLSLPDSDLVSRIDCSSLGPRMLTLNFLTLNFAAEFGMLNLETLKIFALNFLTLNI